MLTASGAALADDDRVDELHRHVAGVGRPLRATHHMVAPAAKWRAQGEGASARSSAGPGALPCPVVVSTPATMPPPGGGPVARHRGLPQGETAVIGRSRPGA